MARPGLTGSRIRERRMMIGMRQAALARQAGISASYLNLIEHNRRRIGGKLLLDLAMVLGVEPAHLSEGAEAALTATLREAAAKSPTAGIELDRAEEFAGRFPGWAQLLSDQHGRIEQLEQSIEALTDRLAHDPHLAASLHEVLSTITAIHSSASILVETKELEREWRDRFHRNIHEDSARLAEGAQRLVDELDAGTRQDASMTSPQEEVETFIANTALYAPAVEAGDPVKDMIADQKFSSAAAMAMAQDRLARLAHDAECLPMPRLLRALSAERALPDAPAEGPNPAKLAAMLNCDTGLVMRRLIALPQSAKSELLPSAPGLVIADASGTLLERHEAEGFALPRFGAACPLWPMFYALSQPMIPLRQRVALASRSETNFVTYAIAQPDHLPQPDRPPTYRSHMLIWRCEPTSEPSQRIGVTCRICPQDGCHARREQSIMAPGR